MSRALSARQSELLRLNAAGVEPRRIRAFLEKLGERKPLELSESEWSLYLGVAPESARRLRALSAAFNVERELETARRLGVALLFEDEPGFPELLASTDNAPVVLYARGSLGNERAPLAFVGSRRPTPYGRRMARALAREAAEGGATIISGMARGIDSECHRAALEAGARTWAVWGCSLDRAYPPENKDLAEQIAAQGCLISEFPFGTPPLPEYFPRRNRIVSGMSWATIVVEGELNSGSLITARLAAEQGRQVAAVPGPVDSRLSDAPHLLITQGARLLRSMADLWPELPPECRPEAAQAASAAPVSVQGLALPQQKILEWLGGRACTVEELAQGLELSLPKASHLLFEMELQDLVVPVEGQRYAKK